MTHQESSNVDHLEWPKTPNDQMTRHGSFKSYQMTKNTKLPCDLLFLKSTAILKWPNSLKLLIFLSWYHLEWPKTPNDQMTSRFSCKCYQMTINAFPIAPEFLKWPNDLEKLNDPSIFYSRGSLWMTKLLYTFPSNDYKYQITIWSFLFEIFILKWPEKPNDCETPDDFRNISV